MSWKALWVSIMLALAWTAAAVWAIRPPTLPAPRTFVVHVGPDDYRVQANEVRVEGFCTVFVHDGARVAGVCGQHTWSEAREVE